LQGALPFYFFFVVLAFLVPLAILAFTASNFFLSVVKDIFDPCAMAQGAAGRVPFGLASAELGFALYFASFAIAASNAFFFHHTVFIHCAIGTNGSFHINFLHLL
jgi:hypothetical protein